MPPTKPPEIAGDLMSIFIAEYVHERGSQDGDRLFRMAAALVETAETQHVAESMVWLVVELMNVTTEVIGRKRLEDTNGPPVMQVDAVGIGPAEYHETEVEKR